MSLKAVSVQDISCFGQCSLTVALPILSSWGIETAILPSAILSTHTGGFTGFTCLDLTDEMPKILAHWIRERITFDAIYTGYIGDVRQFDMILSAKERLLKPDGLLIVDPAMADHGKLYPALTSDIVAGMRELVRGADVIFPNMTEAAFLLDVPYEEEQGRERVAEILTQLNEMGPQNAVLTGVSFEEERLGAVARCKNTGETIEYFTEKLPQSYHGTGDIFSSVAAAVLLNGHGTAAALKEACEFVVSSIKNTADDPSHSWGVKFEAVLAGRRARG